MLALIKDFEPRLYQETIFATAAQKNTLIVLPTGLGKTNIFLMLASHRLRQYPKSKILLLGPTRPLIDQYAEVFKKHFSLPPDAYATLTGFVPPLKRKEIWNSATIVFSTPQGLENDLVSGAISLADVSLLGIDEAHRAVGNYSYVWICKQYMQAASFPRIVGMTASPGDDLETIQEVMANISTEAIEVRTDEDSDVAPYIQDVSVTYERVELPAELKEIVKSLELLYVSRLQSLKKTGMLSASVQDVSKSAILALQSALRQSLQEEQGPEIYQAISLAAEALKIHHAVELAQTQTLHTLAEYLEQLAAAASKGGNKAVQRIVRDPLFLLAKRRVDALILSGFEHPKIRALVNALHAQSLKKPHFKAIVFTQYRDTGTDIIGILKKKGISAKIFVGQAKKKNTGLSQKEQKATTDAFRNNEFSVLVSSSVGEEGLDIPAVDMVVFFEPIPSVIRKIQRAGRTGRLEEGSVVVLMAKGTRDETYHYVSRAKEQRMYRSIATLKQKLLLSSRPFVTPSSRTTGFGQENPTLQAVLAAQPHANSSPSETGSKKEDLKGNSEEDAQNPLAKNCQGQPGRENHAQKQQRQDPVRSQQSQSAQSQGIVPTLIVVDSREKSNPVVKELLNLGAKIAWENLPVGDYLLSKDVVVEFKTVHDFLTSIIDGRLLDQAKHLAQATKPLLVIEGMQEMYFERNIHPNAILGMLSTLALSFRIPIIQTKSPKESAALLYLVAKKEQNPDAGLAALHRGKPASLSDMQEYLVSALPGIGPVLSIPLLSHFKTVESLASASLEDLQEVDLIGEKKARQLFDIFHQEYQKKTERNT